MLLSSPQTPTNSKWTWISNKNNFTDFQIQSISSTLSHVDPQVPSIREKLLDSNYLSTLSLISKDTLFSVQTACTLLKETIFFSMIQSITQEKTSLMCLFCRFRPKHNNLEFLSMWSTKMDKLQQVFPIKLIACSWLKEELRTTTSILLIETSMLLILFTGKINQKSLNQLKLSRFWEAKE